MKKCFLKDGTNAIEVTEILPGTLRIRELKEVGNPPAYDSRFEWKVINDFFEMGSYENKKEVLQETGYKLTNETQMPKTKILENLIFHYGKKEGRMYVLTMSLTLMAIYDPLTGATWYNPEFSIDDIIGWVARGFKM